MPQCGEHSAGQRGGRDSRHAQKRRAKISNASDATMADPLALQVSKLQGLGGQRQRSAGLEVKPVCGSVTSSAGLPAVATTGDARSAKASRGIWLNDSAREGTTTAVSARGLSSPHTPGPPVSVRKPSASPATPASRGNERTAHPRPPTPDLWPADPGKPQPSRRTRCIKQGADGPRLVPRRRRPS